MIMERTCCRKPGLADNTTKNFGVRTRLGFELKLAKGLTINNDFPVRSLQSFHQKSHQQKQFENRDYINQFITLDTANKPTYNIPRGEILNQLEATTNSWSNRFQVNYNNIFNGVHYLNIYGGAEIRKTVRETFSNRKFGYDDELLSWQPILNPKDLLEGKLDWWNGNKLPRFDATSYDQFTQVDNRFLSYFFSTAAYTYDERYTVTGSFRVDESNLFGTDQKYRRTPLWSIGGAWNVSNESFLSALKSSIP